MTIPPTPPLESRLAKAEAALRELTRELAAIRAELRAPAAETRAEQRVQSPAAEPKDRTTLPPIPPRRVLRDVGSLDFERLLGRYGMLGIAVLAAVAAVGTFLSWAISHGYLTLGPAARVLLGLAFAGGIGAWGLSMRRTEKPFGSSLVGLALVIVLVCAYAAGPGFGLVPTWVAFAGSSAIAWGLAIFARAENDEPLWCVAFGGAAIAPFATSNGTGDLYALLAYALVLLLSACFAISHRQWPVAWRVFYFASALFVISGAWLANLRDALAEGSVFALPLVIGAAGILPFAPDSRKRAALRWLAFLALLATLSFDRRRTPMESWLLSGEVLAALALWLLLIDRLRGVPQSSLLTRNAGRTSLLDWIDNAGIPILLALAAAWAAAPATPTPLIYSIAGAMLLVAAWRHPLGAVRDASAFAVTAIAIAVLLELPLPAPLVQVAAFLGLALAVLLMHRLRPSLTWIAMGAILLVASATLSMQSLAEREIYRVPPFSTTPSLCALLVTGALVIVARFWRSLLDATCEAMGQRARRTYADGLRTMLDATLAAPWVWAFAWVLVELAMAYSPSTSTLLLVTYFAATAVMSVAVGRMRRSARIRQLGLGLALAAAATSVYGASTYFDIGIRIVAYLVTSAFLLGIAYWYRRPGAATPQSA